MKKKVNIRFTKMYLLVTADDYELPVGCGDSWRDLSRTVHISSSTLYNAWRRVSIIDGKYRVYVI